MNELKYKEGQRVEFKAGGEARKSLYGEWGVGRITKIKNGICHLSTPFGDEIMRLVDDIRPIPADELQALRAENERLRETLNTISQEIATWAAVQQAPELHTTVALVATIEELVNEVIQ